MHSKRIQQLLLAALTGLSVAQASFVAPAVVNKQRVEVVRRQLISIGLGGDSSAETTVKDTTTTPTTPTTAVEKTTTPQTTTTPATNADNTTPTTPADDSKTTSTTPKGDDDSKQTTAPTTVQPVTTIYVITTTRTDGSVQVVTTQSVTTPTLAASSSNNNNNSSMSKQTKNTIIGVVVGIGGAALLAGLALVAWRVWGRKKSDNDADNLMGYTAGYSAVPVEKSDGSGSTTVGGRTPFQSTLESYHAPTHVNQASNF